MAMPSDIVVHVLAVGLSDDEASYRAMLVGNLDPDYSLWGLSVKTLMKYCKRLEIKLCSNRRTTFSLR